MFFLNLTRIIQSVPPPPTPPSQSLFSDRMNQVLTEIHYRACSVRTVRVPVFTKCIPVFSVVALRNASNQNRHETKNHLCNVHSLMMGYKMSKYHNISSSKMLNLQVGFFLCRGTSRAGNILYSVVILRLQPLKEFLE